MSALLSLPTCREQRICPRALAEAVGESMLIALRARHIQEMPVLAQIPQMLAAHDVAGLTALGALLRGAIERGERLWITTADAARIRELEDVTGPGIVHRIGMDGIGTGDDGIETAIAVRPAELAAALAGTASRHGQSAGVLRAALIDAETVLLPREGARSLHRAELPVRPRSAGARMLRDPRSLAYLVVFAYSSLRVLPVMFIRQFHGSLWVLWGMDVLTAIPYTWGVIAAITGGRWWIRVAGMAVTIVTFVAPYVYFWLHGRGYPPGVVALVAGMIAAGVVLEVGKQLRTQRLHRLLRTPGSSAARSRPGTTAR